VREQDPSPGFEPQEPLDSVGDQRHPRLRHDRILRGSSEGLDPQMLCDGLQEQLDWPALFVDRRDGGGRQVHGNRPKHIAFAGCGVPIPHLPQTRGRGSTVRTGQDDIVVRCHPGGSVDGKARRHVDVRIDLLACDNVHPLLMPREQKLIGDVAAVHGHDAVHGQVEPAGDREITAFALSEHHNGGDMASMVKGGYGL
jgi:hypothetical protein